MKMTKLEVLKSILKDSNMAFSFLGNKAIIPFKSKKVAEVSFASSITSGQYKGLLVTISHKENGNISDNVFYFEQYLGKTANRRHHASSTITEMYVWQDRGNHEWYIVRPTTCLPICKAIEDYIILYMD